MFLLWVLPMFAVLGIVGGLAVRRLNPTTRRGFVAFWLARVLLGMTAALLAIGYAIAESGRPDDVGRAYLAPAIGLFVVGAVAAMVWKPRAKIARKRRIVQPAGSYAVPSDMVTASPPPRRRSTTARCRSRSTPATTDDVRGLTRQRVAGPTGHGW